MILEWLAAMGTQIMAWFTSTFPGWSVPAWLTGLDATVKSYLAGLSGFGAWIDLGLITGALGTVLGVWGVVFIVKFVMWLFSHVPQIGGNS